MKKKDLSSIWWHDTHFFYKNFFADFLPFFIYFNNQHFFYSISFTRCWCDCCCAEYIVSLSRARSLIYFFCCCIFDWPLPVNFYSTACYCDVMWSCRRSRRCQRELLISKVDFLIAAVVDYMLLMFVHGKSLRTNFFFV